MVSISLYLFQTAVVINSRHDALHRVLDKPFGWRIKTQPALSVCFQNMWGNMIEKQNDAE